MSAGLAAGLVIQLLALLLLLAAVGKKWMSYIGAILLLMAMIFHGLTEFIQSVYGGINPYRRLVAPPEVDSCVLWVSVAHLVMTISYVVTLTAIGSKTDPEEGTVAKEILSPVDWRLALGACLPFYLVAISAVTLRSPIATAQPTEGLDYFILGLTSQFLVLGIVLTAFSFLVESQGRHVFAVLFIQSIALALLGQRLTVLIAVVMLLHALSTTGVRAGVRIKASHVVAALLLSAAIATVISSARLAVGRESFKGTAGQRIEALLRGVDFLERSGGTGLAEDFISRFDGNSFLLLSSPVWTVVGRLPTGKG
jgi:hypothetical protein